MNHTLRALMLVATAATAVDAGATDITFDNLAVGTLLSTQYAGVVFSANALTGSGYAANTDMTIVSATGSDVGFGGLGLPSLVSGNVLRSFGSWLNETGDPSFRITFASAIASFSATFAGVYDSTGVQLLAYDGSAQVGKVAGSTADEQFRLSIAGPRITSVIVLPGTLQDYVVVDNIQYVAAVPEPSAWALSAVGLGVVAWAGRQRRASRRSAA